ncbi:hypothetical protein Emag_001185 [Eimeria magna]
MADVGNEEEEGVTVEMEGDDVVIGVPTFEGFEVKEVGEDGTETAVEELGGDFADEEEGAEKRELHLCYKNKCKKMKYKKGKNYKLKKHYKKGKKYGSYYGPAVAAVPMKSAQPVVAAVPTKAAVPVVASVPTKGYSTTPSVVSYSAPTFRSSAPSKGYASAALPQVASYQSAPIKATYMPQLASLLPASWGYGANVPGSNPSTNYLMQRANSVASAASAPSYKVVDNTNLLQRLIVQPSSYSSSQGQKGQ